VGGCAPLGAWASPLTDGAAVDKQEEARLRLGQRDKATEAEITLLREELGEVRRELADVQERLDVAERLLSRTREAERLPGGPGA
jgi:hypothetical protein